MYGHQGGCGVMNWAIGIDMYILICLKLMTKENLLYKKIKINNKINTEINKQVNRTKGIAHP